MYSFLKKINDPELDKLLGSIIPEMSDRLVSIFFEKKSEKHKKYDERFLWLLMWQSGNGRQLFQYIDDNYKKFHQIYDTRFLNKLIKKDGFTSHLWEMIICDILSSYGELIPKKEKGSDFLLRTSHGEEIQVEAIAMNESDDLDLRSIKPDYSEGSSATLSGKSDDLERPILLRFTDGLSKKAKKKTYDKTKPLIIAINTSKVVGFISNDSLVLRWVLFGLGNQTIIRHSDGTHSWGLEQKNDIQGKNGTFDIGWFNEENNDYSHISGVIYTSQQPEGLIPGGYGWSNYGVTYVPNPNALNPVDIDFSCMRKIIPAEKPSWKEEASSDFKSSA